MPTLHDDQTLFRFTLTKHGKPLKSFTVRNLPRMAKGSVTVKLGYTLYLSGKLTVDVETVEPRSQVLMTGFCFTFKDLLTPFNYQNVVETFFQVMD